MTDKVKKPRGFAAIDPAKAFEIRSKGGKSSPTNFKNIPLEKRLELHRRGGLNAAKSK